MTDLDDVTAALYAERFGTPVRSRNSLAPTARPAVRRPEPPVEVEPAAWSRLHDLRDATAGEIPMPRAAG